MRVDYRDLMKPRDRPVHATELRHGPHARQSGETVRDGDDPLRFRVEHDQLPRGHVRDVEPSERIVEALVVEAHRAARQRNIGHRAK